MATAKLHAIALNCTLKSKKARDEKSSTDVLLQQALDAHRSTASVERASRA